MSSQTRDIPNELIKQHYSNDRTEKLTDDVAKSADYSEIAGDDCCDRHGGIQVCAGNPGDHNNTDEDAETVPEGNYH